MNLLSFYLSRVNRLASFSLRSFLIFSFLISSIGVQAQCPSWQIEICPVVDVPTNTGCPVDCDRVYYQISLLRDSKTNVGVVSFDFLGQAAVDGVMSALNVDESLACTPVTYRENFSFNSDGEVNFNMSGEVSLAFGDDFRKVLGYVAIDLPPGSSTNFELMDGSILIEDQFQNQTLCPIPSTSCLIPPGSSNNVIQTDPVSTCMGTTINIDFSDPTNGIPLQSGNDVVVPFTIDFGSGTFPLGIEEFNMDVVLTSSVDFEAPEVTGGFLSPNVINMTPQSHIVQIRSSNVPVVNTTISESLYALTIPGPVLQSLGGCVEIKIESIYLKIVNDNGSSECCSPSFSDPITICWDGLGQCPENLKVVLERKSFGSGCNDVEITGTFDWNAIFSSTLDPMLDVDYFNMELTFGNNMGSLLLNPNSYMWANFPFPSSPGNGAQNATSITNPATIYHYFFNGNSQMEQSSTGFQLTFVGNDGCISANDIVLKRGEIGITDKDGNHQQCAFGIEILDDRFCVNRVDGNIDKKSLLPSTLIGGCNFEKQAVEDVDVTFSYTPNASCATETIKTNCAGYAICACPDADEIIVQPTKNDDPLNGVNTADLLIIQKHLLGSSPLCDIHQFIAADVNESFSVTPSDIIDIREVILGIHQNGFPDVNSWAFIDKNYIFSNPVDPLTEIENLDPDNRPDKVMLPPGNHPNIDFWAIKTGDVDFSAASSCPTTPLRSSSLETEFEQKAVANQLAISPSRGVSLAAWQFSFDLNNIGYSVKTVHFPFPSNGINCGWHITEKNELRIIWFSNEEEGTPYHFEQGKPLFEIEFEDVIQHNNFKLEKTNINFFESVVFDSNLEKTMIAFKDVGEERHPDTTEEFLDIDLSVHPNPTVDFPVFEIQSNQEFEGWLHVTNEMGSKLGSWWIDVNTSNKQVRKRRLSRLPSGSYYVLLETPNGVLYRKWVKL